MMTKTFLITTSLFLTQILFAQTFKVEPSDDFFDMMERNIASYASDTAEGGPGQQLKRMNKIWGERLYPHGDFTIAANAIYQYAIKDKSLQNKSGFIPNWTHIGLSGNPISGSNGLGAGRMHCMAFDPQYSTNNTIYAGTNFGGLWRSLDGGSSWNVVNTDLLPIASVSDIAINPNNGNEIFITTGNADAGIAGEYTPNRAIVNPIFTVGVYRSLDFGATWEAINTGLMQDFTNGGAIRRIIINPTNSNEIYLATSEGVYKTLNALSVTPVWSKISTGIDPLDKELKGLEFNPTNPNTLYCSGRDIYKSTDNGQNWVTMTGSTTGLDVNNLPISAIGFDILSTSIERINVAVSINDSSLLYAYLVVSEEYVDAVKTKLANSGYVYKYNGTNWSKIHERRDYTDDNNDNTGTNLFSKISSTRNAIAVSPFDANEVYIGTTIVLGSRDVTNPASFYDRSPYLQSCCFHADVHGLEFDPVDTNKLFCMHDGGISEKDLTNTGTGGWSFKNNGLKISTLWTFDDYEYDKNIIITGHQDNGTTVHRNSGSGFNWEHIYGGDGFGANINKNDGNLMWFSSNGNLFRHDYTANSSSYEHNLLPNDLETPASTAFLPNTFKMVNHPNTGDMYFSFSEIYRRTQDLPPATPLWEAISNIGKVVTPSFARQIIEYEISQSDPNYQYLATLGFLANHPARTEPKLFRTTNGGCLNDYNAAQCFEDITANLNTALGVVEGAVITGIAIHPSDPQKIWVSLTGYDPTIRVWKSNDAGTTWQNADPNNSLENLPANSIVYQEGTNDRLFLATDAGVYVQEANGIWEKYGDIPNVRVVELKINYCSGKIRAATFGRGLWEGDIPPSTSLTSGRNIIGSETWSGITGVQSNVIIPSGAILTITGTLNMPKDGRIFVQQGGKLIVNGGIITNQCGQLWEGIEVWGDVNTSQLDPSAHGRLEIKNGALIENAHEAVRLHQDLTNTAQRDATTGGIVIASNSTFKNNTRSFEFLKYQNFLPSNPSIKASDLSSIINCEFIYDDFGNMVTLGLPTRTHLTMFATNGVKIRGNDFRNDASYATYGGMERGVGIATFEANYRVESICNSLALPCSSYDNNKFVNLTYGINASSANSLNTFVVDKAEFTNCQRGILVKDIDYARLTRNTFDVASPSSTSFSLYTYGIYLDNCDGFAVEENTITTSVISPNPIPTYGIYIFNSGVADNEIYKNDVANVNIGIQSSNINGNGNQFSPAGLEVKCNELNNLANSSIAINDVLMKPIWGSCLSPTTPINNSFDYMSQFDVWTNPSLASVIYRYSIDPGGINLAPRSSPFTNTNFFGQLCGGLVYSDGGSCPTHLKRTVPVLLSTYSSLRVAANTTAAIIDGGDPEYLISIINNSSDAQIKNELKNASPYLSSKIMISMLNRTPAISNSTIDQVLSDNTPLSDEVFLAMLNRTPSLPDYIIRKLALASSPLSSLEQMALINRTPFLSVSSLTQVMINNSPLFDEVLYALMDRTTAMPDWSIRNIFNQNTPLSDGVQIALTNHSPSYPAWVINSIANSNYTAGIPLEESQPTSPLMEISQEVAEYNRQATLTKNELFRTYLHDTSGTYSAEDVIIFIKNESACVCDTKAECELTKAYISVNDFTKAQEKIDSLIQDTSLTNFCELHNAIIDLNQSNTNLNSNPSAKQKIETISLSSIDSKEKSAAQAMLAFENLYTYQEVFEPIYPINTGASNRMAPPNTVQLIDENYNPNMVSVYPNPAKDEFTVSYNLASDENAIFKLYNIMGKQVLNNLITGVVGEIKFSTDEIKSGIYFYSVTLGENIIMQDKLVVIAH